MTRTKSRKIDRRCMPMLDAAEALRRLRCPCNLQCLCTRFRILELIWTRLPNEGTLNIQPSRQVIAIRRRPGRAVLKKDSSSDNTSRQIGRSPVDADKLCAKPNFR